MRGDLIETYEILKGYYHDIEWSQLFMPSLSHQRTLFESRTPLITELFTQRVITAWDSLPRWLGNESQLFYCCPMAKSNGQRMINQQECLLVTMLKKYIAMWSNTRVYLVKVFVKVYSLQYAPINIRIAQHPPSAVTPYWIHWHKTVTLPWSI